MIVKKEVYPMLEIPESHTISRQLEEKIKGKMITQVIANHSPHGFAFFHGDPEEYPDLLTNKKVDGVYPLAGQVEISIEDMSLVFGDGVNVRYYLADQKVPKKHQLYIAFDDESFIACTIQMYGGISAFKKGQNDNPYYLVTKEKPSPLTKEFDREYFQTIVNAIKPNASVKALLATEQRIPGLGNGSLQDILFRAGINPKRKMESLSKEEVDSLFDRTKKTLQEMTEQGGRDTEKDLYGNPGGYQTYMSKKTLSEPCSLCGSDIIRKAYMGGNVYYCPKCQPI